MSEQIIQSPVFDLQGRAAVAYKGKMMLPSTAYRIKEWSPELRECAAQGMCVPEAARRLGWSIGTIIRWSRLLGIPFNKKRHRKVRQYDKTGWEKAILAGIAAGRTQGNIAVDLGVPLVNIHRFCRDNGINWKHLKQNVKASRQG